MEKKMRLTAALLMLLAVLAAVSMRTDTKDKFLVFADSGAKVAAEVDGEEITLEDMAFYIAYEEGVVEEQAIAYNPENTRDYWNAYSNGTFVQVRAKQAAIDMAMHDEIFYRLALEYDVELNEEEQQYLENDQADFWSDLTDEQKESLGVGEEVLNRTMQKMAIAEKYQYLLAAMNEVDYDDYSIDGDAYQELLKEHDCKINEKVWERVNFGRITVGL